MITAVLVGEHIEGCFAVKVQKEEGHAPWNVTNLIPITCNSLGHLVDVRKTGIAELWYEMKCGDAHCFATKRINSKVLALLPYITMKREKS